MNRVEQWAARYAAGATLRDIAAEVGLSHVVVYRHLAARGVALRKPGSSLETKGDGWAADYAAGQSLKQIAEQAGCSWQAVQQSLRRRGVKLRPAHRHTTPRARDWA